MDRKLFDELGKLEDELKSDDVDEQIDRIYVEVEARLRQRCDELKRQRDVSSRGEMLQQINKLKNELNNSSDSSVHRMVFRQINVIKEEVMFAPSAPTIPYSHVIQSIEAMGKAVSDEAAPPRRPVPPEEPVYVPPRDTFVRPRQPSDRSRQTSKHSDGSRQSDLDRQLSGHSDNDRHAASHVTTNRPSSQAGSRQSDSPDYREKPKSFSTKSFEPVVPKEEPRQEHQSPSGNQELLSPGFFLNTTQKQEPENTSLLPSRDRAPSPIGPRSPTPQAHRSSTPSTETLTDNSYNKHTKPKMHYFNPKTREIEVRDKSITPERPVKNSIYQKSSNTRKVEDMCKNKNIKRYFTANTDFTAHNAENLVTIEELYHPGKFFVKSTLAETIRNVVQSKVLEYVESINIATETTKSHTVGKLVIANFPEDRIWYRSCIVEQHMDNMYTVLFVDYGNTSVVSYLGMVAMPRSLEDVPMCVQQCYLAGVAPPPPSDGWDSGTSTAMFDMIQGSQLTIRVLENTRQVYGVVLLVPTGSNSHYNLNKKLLELGMAVHAQDAPEEDSLQGNTMLGLCTSPTRFSPLTTFDSIPDVVHSKQRVTSRDTSRDAIPSTRPPVADAPLVGRPPTFGSAQDSPKPAAEHTPFGSCAGKGRGNLKNFEANHRWR